MKIPVNSLEILLLRKPSQNLDLHAKKLPRTWTRNPIMVPYRNLPYLQGRFPWLAYPQNILFNTIKYQIHTYFPPWRIAPRRTPGETPGNPDLGNIWDHGVSIIPPKSNWYPIPTPHQLGVVGQVCVSIQAHKGGYGQAGVNWGPSGVGRDGDPCLSPQAEPFILQIYPHIIQEGNNTQESHQGQKTYPLCCLTIWEVPQEAMEY